MQHFWSLADLVTHLAGQLGETRLAICIRGTATIHQEERQLRPHRALVDVLEHRMAVGARHIVTVQLCELFAFC